MEWSRTPPKKAGYYLRLNAGGGIEIRLVQKGKILFGWGGEQKLLPIGHFRLKGWLWYGPIPRPPNVTNRWERGEGE